jgi:hypothetical protein
MKTNIFHGDSKMNPGLSGNENLEIKNQCNSEITRKIQMSTKSLKDLDLK